MIKGKQVNEGLASESQIEYINNLLSNLNLTMKIPDLCTKEQAGKMISDLQGIRKDRQEDRKKQLLENPDYNQDYLIDEQPF